MVKSYRVSYEEMQKNHTLEGFDTFLEQKPQQTPKTGTEQPIHSHLKTQFSPNETEQKVNKMSEETPKNKETSVDKLNVGIGTKETVSLEAKPVKILTVSIEEQKTKEGKVVGDKVVCICKHPDKDEAIAISSVKYEKNNQIKTSGTWFNLDSDDKIQKGSALSFLMTKLGAVSIKAMEGKEAETVIDEKGYLAMKAY